LSRLDRFIGEVDPNPPRQARAPAEKDLVAIVRVLARIEPEAGHRAALLSVAKALRARYDTWRAFGNARRVFEAGRI
jgi:hypothetical protein